MFSQIRPLFSTLPCTGLPSGYLNLCTSLTPGIQHAQSGLILASLQLRNGLTFLPHAYSGSFKLSCNQPAHLRSSPRNTVCSRPRRSTHTTLFQVCVV